MNPWTVGHVVSPLLERLMRRGTFRAYHGLMCSEWWPPETLRELQLLKLRRLVAVALDHTSGYADLSGVGEG